MSMPPVHYLPSGADHAKPTTISNTINKFNCIFLTGFYS